MTHTNRCPHCGGRSALKGVRRCSVCMPSTRITVCPHEVRMTEFFLMTTLTNDSVYIARILGIITTMPTRSSA